MNKTELIRKIAKDAGVNHATASRMLNSFAETVVNSLTKGERVKVRGFGMFKVAEHCARNGYNPQTHQVVPVPAKKTVRFVPSESIKSSIR
ncbi:HU family DNA-binding protein [Alicyclobacillus fodiniaquatilis]|uniref:HU family DNA-binding protein n=1 Tax=Alicyclobacillus fodiniaquatilis TaxID=1661150 RepID=A0ABW4JG44_9BACL